MTRIGFITASHMKNHRKYSDRVYVLRLYIVKCDSRFAELASAIDNQKKLEQVAVLFDVIEKESEKDIDISALFNTSEEKIVLLGEV